MCAKRHQVENIFGFSGCTFCPQYLSQSTPHKFNEADRNLKMICSLSGVFVSNCEWWAVTFAGKRALSNINISNKYQTPWETIWSGRKVGGWVSEIKDEDGNWWTTDMRLLHLLVHTDKQELPIWGGSRWMVIWVMWNKLRQESRVGCVSVDVVGKQFVVSVEKSNNERRLYSKRYWFAQRPISQ